MKMTFSGAYILETSQINVAALVDQCSSVCIALTTKSFSVAHAEVVSHGDEYQSRKT